MHSSPRTKRDVLADYTRAGVILLGAVLMGIIALVVGPTRVDWPATRLVLSMLLGVTAVFTIRFMPIRLPGEPTFRQGESALNSTRNPRTAVVAVAASAGAATAPLLAGVGAFFFLLAILAGWLFGLSVQVILRSRAR